MCSFRRLLESADLYFVVWWRMSCCLLLSMVDGEICFTRAAQALLSSVGCEAGWDSAALGLIVGECKSAEDNISVAADCPGKGAFRDYPRTPKYWKIVKSNSLLVFRILASSGLVVTSNKLRALVISVFGLSFVFARMCSRAQPQTSSQWSKVHCSRIQRSSACFGHTPIELLFV